MKNPKLIRATVVVRTSCAMIHAWCLYFAGVWILSASNLATAMDVHYDSALLKVILAVALSAYAFTLIVLLERLADPACSPGKRSSAGMFAIMVGLGILIGFTWEQAFERSVSTIVQVAAVPGPLLKLVMAFGLVLLVLPAWRIWILKRNFHAEREEAAMLSASDEHVT